MRTLACFALLLVAVPTSAQPIALPQVNDDRLKLELVAQHPDIGTPIAIDMDDAGKLYVIESHTHFPPGNYTGPSGDRIRVYEDLNGDHKADRITNFHVGERHLMSIRLYRADAAAGTGTDAPPLYAATRREIFRLRDTNNDGVADQRVTLVKLETKGDYPHNGLCGITFDFKGDMYFGFGENLGEPYKLIGADGVTLEGGGEGGNIYACDKDGNKLRRVATGFWNPFDITFDAFGRCFAVDNDPDSRPPCRLLHIVEGGDYGYRFKYGRKGLHPFTSWNGEIPGTLPMVAGTGEAPSGVLAYESDNLPDDYLGTLLVTSWGDHRIERYRLKPNGASFTSKMEPIVTGGDNFRPVGITIAPDGSIYFSDWVDKSYNIHGKGRIWRLSAKEEKKADRPDPVKEPEKAILSKHRATREKAAQLLSQDGEKGAKVLVKLAETATDARPRVIALESLSLKGLIQASTANAILADRQALPEVRCVAVKLADLRELKPWDSTKAPPSDFELLFAEMLRRPDFEDRMGHELGVALAWAGSHPDPFIRAYAIQQADGRVHIGTATLADGELPEGVRPFEKALAALVRGGSARLQTTTVLAQRRHAAKDTRANISKYLIHPNEDVRFAATQWVAEEKIVELRQALLDSLSRPDTTPRLFAATLAALDMLDGGKPQSADHVGGRWYLERLVFGDKTPAATRATALRMLPANNPALSFDAMKKLIEQEDPSPAPGLARLRLEAVRTLRDPGWTGGVEKDAAKAQKNRAALLTSLASDPKQPADLRAEAIAGLDAGDEEQLKLLVALANGSGGGDAILRDEAARTLRGVKVSGIVTTIDTAGRPAATDTAAWLKLLDGIKEDAPSKATGNEKDAKNDKETKNAKKKDAKSKDAKVKDAKANDESAKDAKNQEEKDAKPQPLIVHPGERVFFNVKAGGCFRCHTIAGRGGEAGPDLSTIGKTLTRERLLESILQPSKEIAPRFTSHRVKKSDGEELALMFIGPSPDGRQVWSDSTGNSLLIDPAEIESREALKTSIMPDNLHAAMTLREMRDLLAFLESLK